MGGNDMRIETLDDGAALAQRVAEWMTSMALAAKGDFRVSLSGGSTPKALYGLLASDAFVRRFPWDRVFWYWGDERFVPHDHPESNYRMVREVADLARMPMPKVYVIQTDSPNAFATGRNPQHAVVAVTTGIRRILSDRELRGVLGHEMGHVKNRDILTSSIVATVAGAVSMIAQMLMWSSLFGGRDDNRNPLITLVVILIAPIAAMMLQMGISRQRGVGGPHCSPATFGHGGSLSSLAFCDPENRVVAAFVCNGRPKQADHGPRMREIAAAVYEDLGVAKS